MKKWMAVLLTVVLFLGLALPVWADDGQGQAVLPGESTVIGPGETVQGDLAVLGGNLELQAGGRVNGDVVIIAGSGVIDGEVDGHLVVLGGMAELRSNAVIRQNLFTFGANVSKAEGATVQGETVEGFRGAFKLPEIQIRQGQPWQWDQQPFFNAMRDFLRFVLNLVALVVLGVLLVLFLPKQTAVVAQAVTEAGWTSLAVGLLTFLVLLVLVPLLVIICIGIPVAVLLVMVAVAAGLFGWIAIGILVGHRLLAALHTSQTQPVVEIIVGVVVLTLLAQIPCLGWLLGVIASAVGLGAVVLTRFGTVRYAPQPAVTNLPAPPPLPPDVPAPPESDVPVLPSESDPSAPPAA
jgi:cytoskeletal protein CcmA (bactofilin family)